MTTVEFLIKAKAGDIAHFRTTSQFGKAIRWALNKWLKRICEEQGILKPYCVFGNHDGVVLEIDGIKYVGESVVGKGAVLTTFQDVAKRLDKGEQVMLFRPIGIREDQIKQMTINWLNNIKGTPYNYGCLPRLLFKSLFFDLIPSVAGWEWANWCTEGVHKSFAMDPPAVNIFQTLNPTPFTTEQVAGMLPRKFEKETTLELI